MPNIPKTGAAGQRPFDGGSPTAGPQEHGENAPSHGTAGGYEIPFSTQGAPPTKIMAGSAEPKAKPFDPRIS